MNKTLRLAIYLVLSTIIVLGGHAGTPVVYGQDDWILFNDPKNPDNLNPSFEWIGGDDSSAYLIEGDGETITIGTGPKTTSRVNIPVKGDFVAQIEITANISVDESAFLGVSKDQGELLMRFNNYYNDAAITAFHRKGKSQDYNRILTEGGREKFCCWPQNEDVTVFFKVEKRKTLYSLYFSSDGVEWKPFRKNFAMPITDNINLVVGVSSYDGGQSSSATFTKLSVVAK